MDAKQEALFVMELRSNYKVKRFDRDDISLLLAILRCGSDLKEIKDIVPGVNPGALLGAYDKLELLRVESVLAWSKVESDAKYIKNKKVMQSVGKLLPHVSEMLTSEEYVEDIESAALLVEEIKVNIQRMRVFAGSLEAMLSQHKPGSSIGVKLGAELYQPNNPGVYGNSNYLPDRVSSLSPVRVRDLLGESKFDVIV
jgi:hypothetical protein